MKKMKAVVLSHSQNGDQQGSLQDVSIDKPAVENENDLLVQVKGVSVNPVDLKTRQKKKADDSSAPQILGWDGVGVVCAKGSQVEGFDIGDEVFYAGDYTRQGSNSQFQLIDQELVAAKPKSLTYGESVAVPLTGLTAWESLYDRLGITEKDQGKQILIINGAGGVGSMAIQLAKLAGLQVIASASRQETISWVKKMGADVVINHRLSLSEELQRQGIQEIPYILCLYNLDNYWEELAKIIQPQGRICSIVENERPVDLGLLKDKSVSFSWEFMFTRSMYQTGDRKRQQQILGRLADLYDRGELQVTATRQLTPINAANLEEAHRLVGKGKMIGKVVLTGWPDARS